MIDRSANRAIEPAKMLDLRAHPLARRPAHRGDQNHGLRIYIDDTTGKLLQVATQVSAIPEPISSWQIDGDAGLALSRRVLVRHQARHGRSSGAISPLECTAQVLMNFLSKFG